MNETMVYYEQSKRSVSLEGLRTTQGIYVGRMERLLLFVRGKLPMFIGTVPMGIYIASGSCRNTYIEIRMDGTDLLPDVIV